ncbi:HEPN domain-containing protein [Laspinema olomoucense]|uniref:HEPN domain-containing protein n=1 Tax=Laspinema olomoucense D3b TaxID=2953688 RepID=A0ABT2N1T1_9CYAN|nr:HEPN domain-containing protein [Laspinema sp. D3b]MCT7976631.1 HEPN domain-containing protein [Laspinema sp. D3b]
MQSALDQFRISISRVRDLISLHNSLTAQSTAALDLSDMLRSALVLGVSALDYYVHEVVTLGMLEIQRGQRLEPAPPPNSVQSSFSRFQVSLGGARQDRLKALDIASWLENEIAQIQGPVFLQQSYTLSALLPAIATSIQNQLNNTAWLEDEIRERLGYLSFQHPDKIADAIRLISDKKLWEEVANQMGKPQKDIKQQLKAIVDRRNQIAHEADIDPTYGIGSRRNIDAVSVTHAIDFIEEIIETIHQIV